MQLDQLIDALGAVRVEGKLDREVVGLAYDSRRVTPGMIFFALKGRNQDGHAFIPSAMDRGAAAIVCENNGFGSQKVVKVKVRDARRALADAAAAFYGQPSKRLQVIGITGTNGKTTVAFMLQRMLEAAGRPTGLIGTVRYEIGDRMIPALRTTPEAIEIQQMLSQMLRAGCRACAMEVSSHALEQHRVEAVAFDCGVFTNLTQDHLDYHGSMENYYQAKRKLFALLQEGTKAARAVVNVDDPYGARLAEELAGSSVLRFGFGPAATLRATHCRLGPRSSRVGCETPRGALKFELPLIGRHNVSNALAAAGAALSMEVPLHVIQRALNTMVPAPGRLERVDYGQPFGVFVDYAHTDDALKNVLTTLREVTTGRLLLVFGCGGNRDRTKRPKMGKVAATLADFTVITTDNPRQESAATIATSIAEGFRLADSDRYRIELDRRRAIDELLRHAHPGDTVLVAGKGHETYQEFENTVVPFDDRACAQDTLALLGFAEESPN